MTTHLLRKIDTATGMFIEDIFWEDGQRDAVVGIPKMTQGFPSIPAIEGIQAVTTVDGVSTPMVDITGNFIWTVEPQPEIPAKLVQETDSVGNLLWEVAPVEAAPASSTPADLIETPVPEGFMWPKWTGTQWIEGRTLLEILPPKIATLTIRVDSDVDAIYIAAIGNRQSEYELAEKEAIAFKEANYTGTVPSSIQAWATAKNQTPTWATDSIIAAAIAWRTAQAVLRATRLLTKETIRNCTDLQALVLVETQWKQFIADIRKQLDI